MERRPDEPDFNQLLHHRIRPERHPLSGCTRPFNPSLAAGTENPTAGKHTPFTLRLNREDGDQNITGVSVKTPSGFAATLRGIPYCPQAALDLLSNPSYSGLVERATPACPAASQVGTAVAAAGAGTHPLYTSGKVYLAGPYKGAPLSLVVVVPALSGPYDLGPVAVRVAISVDPVTCRSRRVRSDSPDPRRGPAPAAKDPGRPRPSGFHDQPDQLRPFSVDAAISGDEGALANESTHFQVGNCSELPFGPKLGLKLRGSTKHTGHPRFRLC